MSLFVYETDDDEKNVPGKKSSAGTSSKKIDHSLIFDANKFIDYLNKPATNQKKNAKSNLSSSSHHQLSPLALNHNNSNIKNNNEKIEKEQLTQAINDKETHILNLCNEYDKQYENFFKIAKKYHLEKLNNLKIEFKNQILKQQIYFETELFEISKECNREYENYATNNNKVRKNNNISKTKFEKEKNLIKLFRIDMKRLIDYMREALINSSDTLMEAFETCKCLKSLEQIEKSVQKQNSNLKSSTKNLLNYNKPNLIIVDGEEKEDDDDDDDDDDEKQLTDEQIRFNKYQSDMDELMHTLDDIELQHLQRKDLLTTKTKFLNKLKSKFKFIETKYDALNKQITNLKYESYVYRELWLEKKRSLENNKSTSTNDYIKSSTMSSSLSPSTSSRSSSTSSLSDCYHDAIDTTTSNRNSATSSCSSSSSSILSEIIDHDLIDEFEDILNLNNINNSNHDNKNNYSNSNSSSKFINGSLCLSPQDYNRKLNLINNLISLYKAKQSSKDIWTFKNSELSHNNNNINNRNDCLNDESMNEKSLVNESDNANSSSSNMMTYICKNSIQNSNCSLDLCECSTYGDKVVVENFNLKIDHDISNWYITRQIENMSVINRFKLPNGSVIKSGKVLKINEPFQNDQIDFLFAIKQKQMDLDRQENLNLNDLNLHQQNRPNKILCLKIITKLITPDGIVKSIHTQEVPQFYQEIFKYANLIKFL